ncbi:glutamate ABC transporter substrate-binding protein [Streptomyces sp. TLI_146]|uniref:glutamate ABC transporter substrate-binding protein n=1 Tax=Streptomyces sp. TLI_146 TaxID=1938858 RepID=UPI000C70A3C4|nr:glutamate ABC transporter substrate-binding protein [Streptomyces sp. TLI_146]PKV85786.1 amino acid ABC transporter substrate-binding protein (PAAT family) [Streptomyces sp. TLI_146]
MNGKGRLRGWGGVGGMALALAAAASLLVPLSRHGAGEDAAQVGGTGVGQGVQAKADTCKDPDASLPPSADGGPTIDRIKQRGKLIVGVDQNSYRWGYRNPATGQLEGFDIELVRAIAKNILGDPDAVIYRAIPTSQRIPAIQKKQVDVVVRTMTINCKRIGQVAFSSAYFKAGQQVLAPKESSITGYNDTLKGKKVCVAAGSTAYDKLEEKSFGAVYKSPTLPVANQLDCLVRLQLGEVDAVVTDNALAAGQAAQDPAVKLQGDPFTEEYYGVATNLESTDLVRRINQVLEDYRSGGANSPWMKAYRDWLAADLPGISGPPAPKYR